MINVYINQKGAAPEVISANAGIHDNSALFENKKWIPALSAGMTPLKKTIFLPEQPSFTVAFKTNPWLTQMQIQFLEVVN